MSATREDALTMYGVMDGQTTREDGASRASVASICRYWSLESFDNLDGEAQLALRFCLERAADLLSVKAPTSTYLTDDGETLSTADLIARIIDPVSFENARQGGKMEDAEWRCNRARDKAAHILDLIAERLAGVEGERDVAVDAVKKLTESLREATRLMSDYARQAGEAKGRLEMSEAAGVVDMWREHAQAAEAERDAVLEARLAEAVDEIVDLLAEAADNMNDLHEHHVVNFVPDGYAYPRFSALVSDFRRARDFISRGGA